MYESPAMMALKTYRIGATKIKVNSTGSVMPVRKQVSAAENQNTGRDFFILSMRFVIHRQTGGRQREQHQREFPCINLPAFW